MSIRIDREFLTALAHYNTGIRRARLAYRLHPYEDSPHTPECPTEGCSEALIDRAKRIRRANYVREYRARRRAQGKPS
jgi:hypothetical protein